jgi:hypothetical protein
LLPLQQGDLWIQYDDLKFLFGEIPRDAMPQGELRKISQKADASLAMMCIKEALG